MDVKVRKHEQVCVVDLSGELKFGQPTALLRKTSKELVARGEQFFLFNMLGVPWLDSSGIGEVVACYKRAREQKGVVKLVLRGRSRSSFTFCQLDKMFDIFDDVDEALASFDAPDGGYRAHF